MKILFFDTETSGLPDFNKRARDPSQPHIVELSAQLTDAVGRVLDAHWAIVKPDGWTIPKEVSDIHGITQERAMDIGVDEKLVLVKLFEMIKRSDLLVAYNVTFDKFIARIGLRRFEIFTDAEDAWWKQFPTFCPMREITDLVAIPHANGRGNKWPKLQEAYQHCFGKSFDGAHSALADVNACKEIYFWLKSREEVLSEK